jgi:hypothetical protein
MRIWSESKGQNRRKMTEAVDAQYVARKQSQVSTIGPKKARKTKKTL